MPRRHTSQVATALAVLMASGASTPGQEAADDPWAPLNLMDVPCDQCRLRVDPVFRDRVDEIGPWVSKVLAAHREQQAQGTAIAENATEILARINEILGFHPDELQWQKQFTILNTVTRLVALPFAPPDEFTLIITDADTVKNYLQTGGTLPGHSYDPENDQASYDFGIEGSIEDVAESNSGILLSEFVIPTFSIDKIDPATDPVLFGDGAMVFFALHEVIEITIHEMIDFADRNGRWFGDGFANAITMIILRERGMNDAAEKVAHTVDVTRFEDIPKTDLILRFWPNSMYEIRPADATDMMTEYESRLRGARYAWSYHECKRIIDDHGIEIVAKIMQAAAEQVQLKSQYLPGIVSTVTGDDISARLNEYQDFVSYKQGLDAFDLQAMQLIEAGEFEKAFTAASRAIEIALRRQYPGEFMSGAAFLLCEMGRVEDAAAYVKKLISQTEENMPQVAEFWRSQHLVMAIHFGRTEIAYESIDPLLEREDVPPIALAALAHRILHADGNPAEARALAEQLLREHETGLTDQQRAMLESVVTESMSDRTSDDDTDD